MKNATLPRKASGFTLMEMMLVLLIIALILGAVAYRMTGFEDTAQRTATSARIRSIESALMSYKLDNMTYPTQQQGLEALVARPAGDPQPRRWKQYLGPDGILDPWGRKIQYRNPGKHNPQGYDVFSMGPDGVESAQDDIGNW